MEEKILITELVKEVSNQALSLDKLNDFIEWVLGKISLIVESTVSILVIKYSYKTSFYVKIEEEVEGSYIEALRKKVVDTLKISTSSSDFAQPYQTIFYGEDKIITPQNTTPITLQHFHCVSFLVRNNVLGGIAISSKHTQKFLPYKINMFNTFANQVGLGIESLKAREEVIKQTRLIEENKAKMEAAFSSIHEGLIMVDNNNHIVFSNPAAREMLHMKEEALEIPGEFSSVFLPLFENLRKDSSKMVSREIQTPSGRILQIELTSTLDKQGNNIGTVILLRDITRLREIENMRSEFVSTVSHELRTPLATIKEAISQVLEGLLGETTPQQKEFLNICLEDIDRLTRIINGLLDISKIEAHRLRIKKDNVDIVKLVKGVVASFTPRFKEKGLEIKTNFSSPYLEVYCDRDKIIQVFTNLVSNALKFTDSGYIEISVSEEGEEVKCSVRDTGKGIAPENLDKVFDKFMQFGREYGPGEKGTGLGLAITKGIIELHRGRIWVESKLGEGTKFSFTLPQYKPQEEKFYEEVRAAVTQEKDFTERLVFVLRIDNYSKIEESTGNALQTIKKLQKILETKRNTDIVIGKDNLHIMIITYGTKEDVNQKREEIRRALKEAILETTEEVDIEFSYGCFALSYNAIEDFEETFNNFCSSLISEKDERLRKKIMVVDDDHEIVSLVIHALNEMGYHNITEAYNGEEVLRYLEEKNVDLIILDMKMPKMNGYEVIGHLKEHKKTKDIAILIMSGYRVEYERLGDYIIKEKAIPVIGKPLNLRELKKLVDYLL
mgnify:CR=1 FL=1